MELGVLDWVFEGLRLALELAAPPVLALWGVGWLNGLLQSLLHVSDPGLAFVPKLAVALWVLVATADDAQARLLDFVARLWVQLSG